MDQRDPLDASGGNDLPQNNQDDGNRSHQQDQDPSPNINGNADQSSHVPQHLQPLSITSPSETHSLAAFPHHDDSFVSHTDDPHDPLYPSDTSVASNTLNTLGSFVVMEHGPHTCETTTTSWQAYLHLVKGYIGPGCLSLPWAVSQLGVGAGILTCWIMALWSSWNCWVVVRLKRRMVVLQGQASAATEGNGTMTTVSSQPQPTNTTGPITYPDVARWLCGTRLYRFTLGSMAVQQLAICTVFLSFVGTNLQALVEGVSHTAVITMALPAVLVLSCLPNLKSLSPVTALGTALLVVGLGVLGVVLVLWDTDVAATTSESDVASSLWLWWANAAAAEHDDDDIALAADNAPDEDDDDSTTLSHWSRWPLAACAILYSYEGICLILPVENSMGRGPANQRFGYVFVWAMVTAAWVFSVVAGVCVARLGQISNGSITAFLLEEYHKQYESANDDDAEEDRHLLYLILAANALVSLSVLVTYPLQLFPVVELWDQRDAGSAARSETNAYRGAVRNEVVPLSEELDTAPALGEPSETFKDEEPTAHTPQKSTFGILLKRTVLVLLTYIVAVAVPNVQLLIALAGALAGSSTALLIPPILELAWIRQKQQQWSAAAATATPQYGAQKATCWLLLLGGVLFLLIGTVASIVDIVRAYQ